MKHCHSILFLLLILPMMPLAVYPQTNRALFIVIEKYSLDNGWHSLNCVNDYRLLKPLLLANNFAGRNIESLIDEQATKEGIITALKRLARETRKGDYIYIQFSGHGQQMADDNFDEDDGWDEAFIPYDAYYRYEPDLYTGEKHLRDDELEVYLDAIRRKAGPSGNVVVIIDACHSATGTRDEEEEYIRGTATPFDKSRYTDARITSKQKTSLSNSPAMSPLTVFTACKACESNREYPHSNGLRYGRLSFALHSVLSTDTATYTVKGLMEAISKCYATLPDNAPQTPTYESTNPEQVFKLSR